jgi:dihydroorotase
VALSNAYASIGWMDVGVFAGEPGYEHRENLQSAAQAAAAGGFTALACLPNTQPALHSKSEVSFVLHQSAQLPARFFPIGALSQDCAGKDLAELYDMHNAGAIAFSDGLHAIQDAGLLLRAMQYATAFKGLIINHPHHKGLASGGQMHEGIVSTSLGLKGLPDIAEHLMVQRDLSLLEYAGPQARLHLHLLSSARSVEMVRKAKAAGLPVTASVALANLCFTDQQLAMQPGASPFDSHLKVQPPLRSQKDADALLEGVLDGTIDFICTHHIPWDEEAKNLEFPYAEFGMTGLETAWSMYCMYLSERLPLERWVSAVAVAPRALLGISIPEIAVGQSADLTVFEPEKSWTLSPENARSRSLNTPLLNRTLQGKVWGTVLAR